MWRSGREWRRGRNVHRQHVFELSNPLLAARGGQRFAGVQRQKPLRDVQADVASNPEGARPQQSGVRVIDRVEDAVVRVLLDAVDQPVKGKVDRQSLGLTQCSKRNTGLPASRHAAGPPPRNVGSHARVARSGICRLPVLKIVVEDDEAVVADHLLKVPRTLCLVERLAVLVGDAKDLELRLHFFFFGNAHRLFRDHAPTSGRRLFSSSGFDVAATRGARAGRLRDRVALCPSLEHRDRPEFGQQERHTHSLDASQIGKERSLFVSGPQSLPHAHRRADGRRRHPSV